MPFGKCAGRILSTIGNTLFFGGLGVSAFFGYYTLRYTTDEIGTMVEETKKAENSFPGSNVSRTHRCPLQNLSPKLQRSNSYRIILPTWMNYTKCLMAPPRFGWTSWPGIRSKESAWSPRSKSIQTHPPTASYQTCHPSLGKPCYSARAMYHITCSRDPVSYPW